MFISLPPIPLALRIVGVVFLDASLFVSCYRSGDQAPHLLPYSHTLLHITSNAFNDMLSNKRIAILSGTAILQTIFHICNFILK